MSATEEPVGRDRSGSGGTPQSGGLAAVLAQPGFRMLWVGQIFSDW